MTLDPALQFTLFAAAFLGGAAFGLLGEVGKILRILLGAYLPPPEWRARYERPLPLLPRGLRFQKAAPRRAWARGVSFFMDLTFPVLAALYLLIILFRFNNGVFRFSVPLLFLLGLAIFRVLLVSHLRAPLAAMAYLLCVFGAYLGVLLLLPTKMLWLALCRWVLGPFSRLSRAVWRRVRVRYTRRLCQKQLSLAARGFLPIDKGKKKYVEKKKKGRRYVAPHPHHTDSDRRDLYHLGGHRI